MIKKTVCGLLFAGICFAAYSAESLAQFFSPYADAYLYFTNRNMERKVDPGLWNRIEKDKKEAAAQNDGDQEDTDDILAVLLNTFHDRDATAIVNVYVLSVEKQEIVLEGVVELSGNPTADLEAVRKKNGRLTKAKSDSQTVFEYKDEEGIGLKIIIASSNTIHFRLDLNYDNPLPFVAFKPYKDPAKLPNLNLQEQLFVLNIHPDSIARLMSSEQDLDLKNVMRGISNLFLSGRLDGKLLKLSATAECLDVQKAQDFSLQVNRASEEMLPHSPLKFFFTNMKSSSSGKTVRMEMEMDMEESWGAMKSLTSEHED